MPGENFCRWVRKFETAHGLHPENFPEEDKSMAAATTALHPGKLSDKVSFRPRYGNYIGGKWVEPASGQYFENITPITGMPFCEIPRSNAKDIELALDAAHAAREAWGHTSPTQRAIILNQIAQRMEDNLAVLALAETWDNGKPIRETTAADLPLAVDHWRYFAGLHSRAGGRNFGD